MPLNLASLEILCSAHPATRHDNRFIVFPVPAPAVEVNGNALSLAYSLSHIDNALVNVMLSSPALACEIADLEMFSIFSRVKPSLCTRNP